MEFPLRKEAILQRAYLDNATFGKLTLYGAFVCYTVEKPWLSNEPYISCIPAGDYAVFDHVSPRHGSCYYLENRNLGVSLDNGTIRTSILIHVANFPNQLEGCIAPGLKLHPSTWGVSGSRAAMQMLKSLEFDSIVIC